MDISGYIRLKNEKQPVFHTKKKKQRQKKRAKNSRKNQKTQNKRNTQTTAKNHVKRKQPQKIKTKINAL